MINVKTDNQYKIKLASMKSEIFLMILLCMLILSCHLKNGKEDNISSWIYYAKSFIAADRLIRLNANEPSFLEYLEERNRNATEIENYDPSVREIEKIISSNIIENQKIACVAVYSAGVYSDKILKYLVDILYLNSSYELKRFSLMALSKISPEDIEPYEMKIFKAIEKEKDELVLTEELIFLIRFSPNKTLKIAKYILINKKDAGVKRLAYTLLHRYDPEYARSILKELKQKGEIETLKIIEEMK